MKRILTLAAMALALSCGTALAGHGKAGLWNVSTTMNMAAAMPPALLAQMKKAGMAMPAVQTITNQMCMTEAETRSDTPPQMGGNDPGCQTHVIRQTASSMATDMVCNGRMKGSGHLEIAYSGAEHYTGSYAFKGVVAGHPSNLSTRFKGDWVKTDCGSVKPYIAKKQ